MSPAVKLVIKQQAALEDAIKAARVANQCNCPLCRKARAKRKRR